MKRDIVKIIGDSLRQRGIETLPAIEVEIPPKDSMGDMSTPVAMSLASLKKKPPRKIAEEIISSIKEKDIFKKIEIAGPGFINFTFSKEYLYSEIKKLLKHGGDYLREDIGKGKRVLIEFISATPTGPLHLGPGRGGAT